MKVGDVVQYEGEECKILKIADDGIVINVYSEKRECVVVLDSRYDCFPVNQQEQDPHYQKEVQPIDLIEAFNLDFNAGNVIKYVARAKHKGNELDDLRKAKYYLDRLYEKANGTNEGRRR